METGRGVDNVAQHELLVYFLGMLKFLSGNSTVAKMLAGKQHLTALSQILTAVNNTVSSSQQLGRMQTRHMSPAALKSKVKTIL